MKGFEWKQFEWKHIMMEASSDLSKSLVMLNRKFVWQDGGNAYKTDTRKCKRVVEALNLKRAKTVVPPAVRESENVECESIRECSWEPLRALESQGERASMSGELHADKTSLYGSAVASVNCWAVDRPDIQYAVRACSMLAGNIRCGQHFLRRWSNDQTVIALSSGEAELNDACMATQQAMGTESMARELGARLNPRELQVDANTAVETRCPVGTGKSETL